MNDDTNKALEQSETGDRSGLKAQLQEISTFVQTVVREYDGDVQNLLAVLRTLEVLHRQIRDDLFEPSLPNTRKDLYPLLRDIEESGGWPYIERMKLQELLQHLQADSTSS